MATNNKKPLKKIAKLRKLPDLGAWQTLTKKINCIKISI